MKHYWIGLIALTLGTRAWAQGTIFFYNRVPSAGIDAPVFDVGGTVKLSGYPFVAQLYAGPSISSLQPVGAPVPFRFGEAVGYWGPSTGTGDSLVRSIPTVVPGQEAYVQVRAFSSILGSTYEDVDARGGKRGTSEILQIPTGGDTKNGAQPPTLPAYLLGLQPWTLQGFDPIIPEPGTLALAALGGLIFWWQRRTRKPD